MMLGFPGRKAKVLAMVLTAHEESAFPKTPVVIYFIGYYTSLLGPVSTVPFVLSSSCPDGYKHHSPTCSVNSG